MNFGSDPRQNLFWVPKEHARMVELMIEDSFGEKGRVLYKDRHQGGVIFATQHSTVFGKQMVEEAVFDRYEGSLDKAYNRYNGRHKLV
jgi:hypothetical protein